MSITGLRRLKMTDMVKSPRGLMNKAKAQEFIESLQNQPEVIKVNKFANNAKFVPIAVVEKTLDEMYLGLWQTCNFKYMVVVNEIVGDLELKVFHPLLKEWITRSGTASVPITVKKNTSFTDVNNKIINACITVVPHVKAECLKNAARSLGALFGRNLNREEDLHEFSSIDDRAVHDDTRIEAETALQVCETIDEVKVLLGNYGADIANDYSFRQMFYKRIKEIRDEKT